MLPVEVKTPEDIMTGVRVRREDLGLCRRGTFRNRKATETRAALSGRREHAEPFRRVRFQFEGRSGQAAKRVKDAGMERA
jgi:hypothetical protein